jgi:hypothetical protein
MTKYRFVGDIHGQIDVMKLALDCDADRVIFCGDFVDSFRRDVQDQIECVELALELAGNGRVDVVWANHEWSYMHPKMHCSGWKEVTNSYMLGQKDNILKKFKPFIYEAGYLVTHAGLNHRLWKEFNMTMDTFQQILTEWAFNMDSPFFDIGWYRGGRAPTGGPLWCDFNAEFEPIPELPQIFGHTRGKGIRKAGNAFCIDTLENTEPQFLDIEID